MDQVTSAMEVTQINDTNADNGTSSAAPQPQPSSSSASSSNNSSKKSRSASGGGSSSSSSGSSRPRPFDVVASAGPPASPIDFPQPRFERGRRDDVLVYDEYTGSHQVAKNVLFRDYSREYGESPEKALSRVRQAYSPIPNKQKINTIMGHVEICMVLARCDMDCSSDDDKDDDGSSSGSDDDDDDDEGDVVFQVTDRLVAVKVNYSSRMEKYRGRHAENPLQEIAAMQLIGNNHPHVMGVIEVLFDGTNLDVVMPYAGSGDLFQMLQESQERGTGFTEPEARYWFRQLVAGVRHLHTRGVAHRDLSPENVMIDDGNSLIIDMGMAIRVPYTDPKSTTNGVTDIAHGTNRRLILPQGACGKLPYMSPEVYRNKVPFDGEAIDIWTAGTIFFCMVTGNRSYSRPHDSDAQFYWMTHGLSRLLTDWGIQLSKECVHLMTGMLQVNPSSRLSLDEVENHPWFDKAPDVRPAIF